MERENPLEAWYGKSVTTLAAVVVFLAGPVVPADSSPAAWVGDLDASETSVRRQAALRLGAAGNGEAVPALVAALGDEEARVRAAAAKGLGMLKDEQQA